MRDCPKSIKDNTINTDMITCITKKSVMSQIYLNKTLSNGRVTGHLCRISQAIKLLSQLFFSNKNLFVYYIYLV